MHGDFVLRLTNRAILVVLGVLGLVWVLAHATHIVVVLFMAVLLAAACSTAANRLERYRVKRSVTILTLYLLIVTLLIGVVALIVPLIRGEIVLLRTNLPTYEVQANDLLTRLPHESEPLKVNDLIRELGRRLQGVALDASRSVLGLGSAFVTLLLIFVIAFFLAVCRRERARPGRDDSARLTGLRG
jgi:predicted PurR-regulated permease PerM